MTDNTQPNILNNINSYFDNISYSEHYNNDIWFTIIIFLVVIVIAIYFYIISSLRSLKKDWQENKCNPLYMPYASLINSDDVNGSHLDYIANNFEECLNVLNSELAQDAKTPLNFIQNSISGFFGLLFGMFVGVQEFVVYLFNLIFQFFSSMMNKIQMLLLNIKLFFMNTNDFLRKIVSMFTVMYYTIILLIRSWKLMFVVALAGWVLTMVVPASVSMLTILVALITFITSFVMWFAIWPIGPFIAIFFIVPIILYNVSFIIALIWFIITVIMFAIFRNSIREIKA